MSNGNVKEMTNLHSAASFCGGGGGGGGGGDYGASPGTTNGSYKDGGHMHSHGGLVQGVGAAAVFGAGLVGGGMTVAAAATTAAGMLGGAMMSREER